MPVSPASLSRARRVITFTWRNLYRSFSRHDSFKWRVQMASFIATSIKRIRIINKCQCFRYNLHFEQLLMMVICRRKKFANKIGGCSRKIQKKNITPSQRMLITMINMLPSPFFIFSSLHIVIFSFIQIKNFMLLLWCGFHLHWLYASCFITIGLPQSYQ